MSSLFDWILSMIIIGSRILSCGTALVSHSRPGYLSVASCAYITDTVVSPELFAESLCSDFSLPPQHFVPKIVAAIAERMREYRDQVLPLEPRFVDACRGRLEQGSEEWEAWRRARAIALELVDDSDDEDPVGDEHEVRTDEGGQLDDGTVQVVGSEEEEADQAQMALREAGENGDAPSTPGKQISRGRPALVKQETDSSNADQALEVVELPMTVEEAMDQWGQGAEGGDDLRILIKVCCVIKSSLYRRIKIQTDDKVDILVGTHNLSDSFEWDLASPVTPEEFAALHCKELGLGGEFA
jgi:SWI/SNF-related matrix-associated actin-dependent regulator of chromatin subfamily B protein 1